MCYIRTFCISIIFFSSVVLACPQADLTGDCFVGLDDLAILAEQWLDPIGCLSHPDDCADLIGAEGVNLEDFAVLSKAWLLDERIPMVINEIHYNPDLSYELVEFIELYNAGDKAIDLSGWYFSKGVTYTFPPGTNIAGGEYIVVTEDNSIRTISPKTTVAKKYGIPSDRVYGPFAGRLSNEGEMIELRSSTGIVVDHVDYQLGFPWPMVGDGVPEWFDGNGYSIQLVNSSFDNDLGGSWRSAYPTPAAANAAVYASNIPPQVRQVKHEPEKPVSNEIVTITAKVTDPDGIAFVTLGYQLVNPGSYICIKDSSYGTNWTNLMMRDDGLEGDTFSGDGIYTVQMPAALQMNRRLIRYRISVEDSIGNYLCVPYDDDPQPNFAYFVYDGVPAWTGADRPGVTAAVEFGTDVMRSLPAYHLIAKEVDVLNSQYNSSYANTQFNGTLIYDGVVYDHIGFKSRGEASTYESGKNKWKFFFNRGHEFQARDNYGQKYKNSWKIMNLSACAVPWVEMNRGMLIDEAVAFALYKKAGVISPNTSFLQFRVIDSSVEASASNQYDGDLWGVYLTIEHPDGRFLDEHDLADGNSYKIEGGVGDKKNQGPTQSVDNTDLNNFIAGYKQINTTEWWQQNLDLSCYFSFRAINRVVNNMDLRDGWNIYYYHNPTNNLWQVIPWDLDMLYVPTTHWSGVIDIQNCLSHSAYRIAYKNRGRELQDLLLNHDQLGQLVDEYAELVNPSGQQWTMTDVEQFMWNYHPRTTANHIGAFYRNPATAAYWPNITRTLVTADHEGLVQWMKDFMLPAPSGGSSHTSYGADFLNSEVSDSYIPATPSIAYTGSAGYPENDLMFECSAFSDPQGMQTFGSMKWRIAEVEPFSLPAISPNEGGTVVFVSADSEWKYFKGTQEPSSPMSEWQQLSFNDDTWLFGESPIGYGSTIPAWVTELADMRNNYSSVYLRKEFHINNPSDIETLRLSISYDEGFNLWINGTHLSSVNVPGVESPYTATAPGYISGQTSTVLTYTNPADFLVSGTNIIAVQLLNNAISSSDCLFLLALEADLIEDSGVLGGYDFVYTGKPGKYEIDAVWESPEITTFSNTIRIPADGIKAGHTYRVRCKMKDNTGRWSHWSDPNQFVAGKGIDADILDYLRVSEVMYNNGNADFIELTNIGTTILNLNDVSITDGVNFSFAGSNVTTLAPGDYVLVVKDQTAFEAQYGTGLNSKIAGVFVNSSLSNGGETVKVEDYWNGTIVEYEYNDSRGWPIAADGAGHSLVPLEQAMEEQPLGTLDYGANWRQSTYIGGSPGTADPASTVSVVINEFMAHTDYSDSSHPDYDSNDWIELYNAGTSMVILNGNWYLSDDPEYLKKWALPTSVLPSNSYISYDEITGFHNPITSGFGLDKAGEQLFLSYLPGTSEDRVVDCIKFQGQENSISLSRYPDGGDYWFHTCPHTRGTANSNPIDHVVISEIMYHPLEDTPTETYDEYVELYNPTQSPVDLWTVTGPWVLDGDVEYTFPASTTLQSGARVLVVDFDPADTARLTAFESAYGTGALTPGVDIFGPWSGDLSNNGGRLTLGKPQDSDDPANPLDISWIIVDECIYNDYWPWPMSPDGTGDSLERILTVGDKSGNDPTNWQTATSGSAGT